MREGFASPGDQGQAFGYVMLGSEPPGADTHEYQLELVFQPHTLPFVQGWLCIVVPWQ
jgi:hypothetical protein